MLERFGASAAGARAKAAAQRMKRGDPGVTVVLAASEVPEIAAHLRTGRLSRFRLLDIACRANGRLAQILATGGAGPVLLAKARIGQRRRGQTGYASDSTTPTPRTSRTA